MGSTLLFAVLLQVVLSISVTRALTPLSYWHLPVLITASCMLLSAPMAIVPMVASLTITTPHSVKPWKKECWDYWMWNPSLAVTSLFPILLLVTTRSPFAPGWWNPILTEASPTNNASSTTSSLSNVESWKVPLGLWHQGDDRYYQLNNWLATYLWFCSLINGKPCDVLILLADEYAHE